MPIKKGDLVEFAREYHQHWPPTDKSKQLYGVAVEDERPEGKWQFSVMVETPSGVEKVQYVYAYAWMGWMPEELEPIYMRLNPLSPDYTDYFEEGY